MRVFLALCEWLDRVATAVAVIACICVAVLVLAIVVMRYCFGVGYIEMQDLANYAFAVLLIFSLPVCLRRGGHVRVEVFSERFPPSYQRRADALALVVFLIPVYSIAVWAWWPELAYSWSILEGSVETGGLGGLFVVRTALPAGAVLMILQGIAMVLDPADAE